MFLPFFVGVDLNATVFKGNKSDIQDSLTSGQLPRTGQGLVRPPAPPA
jgi:hypothetical protein